MRCFAGESPCSLSALAPDGARALLASEERLEQVDVTTAARRPLPGFGPGALALWFDGDEAVAAFPSGLLFAGRGRPTSLRSARPSPSATTRARSSS